MGAWMDDKRADVDFLHGQAPAYARLAPANVRRAYPVQVTYVATGPAPPPRPTPPPPSPMSSATTIWWSIG